MEGAWASNGFLVVVPVNAEFIESGSGNDTVNITSSGDDTAPNYISLGDGNDRSIWWPQRMPHQTTGRAAQRQAPWR